MTKDRFAAPGGKLLGQYLTGPQTLTGRNDNRCERREGGTGLHWRSARRLLFTLQRSMSLPNI